MTTTTGQSRCEVAPQVALADDQATFVIPHPLTSCPLCILYLHVSTLLLTCRPCPQLGVVSRESAGIYEIPWLAGSLAEPANSHGLAGVATSRRESARGIVSRPLVVAPRRSAAWFRSTFCPPHLQSSSASLNVVVPYINTQQVQHEDREG